MEKSKEGKIKIKFSEKDAEKLWNRLFGEEKRAALKNLSDKEFDSLERILKKQELNIDWEGNKGTKTIYIWQPKSQNLPSELYNEYAQFLLLIAFLTGNVGRKKYLGSGKANKNNS